jgi:undecaprenyl-diphosphatase
LLWLGERRRSAIRTIGEIHLRDAVAIGAAQALALFPGISRSGITIATGMLIGISREAAARFSFLMAVPVIAGAGLWKARTLIGEGVTDAETGQLLVGVVTSSVVGFIAIATLLRFLRTNPTTVFVVYRIAFAILIVVAWLGLWDR